MTTSDKILASMKSAAVASIAEAAVAELYARHPSRALSAAEATKAIEERLAAYDPHGVLRYDVESTHDPVMKRISTTIRERIPVVVRQVEERRQ